MLIGANFKTNVVDLITGAVSTELPDGVLFIFPDSEEVLMLSASDSSFEENWPAVWGLYQEFWSSYGTEQQFKEFVLELVSVGLLDYVNLSPFMAEPWSGEPPAEWLEVSPATQLSRVIAGSRAAHVKNNY